MTKSNGIKSLKQAAKLLNKHAPDGESLAYINPDEAKLLKSHGGSGIMTLHGVPTYGPIDWFKETIYEPYIKPAAEWLGYEGDQGGGRLLKDVSSLGGAYVGYKEAQELSEWEKKQYEEQKAQELLNQLKFAQQSGQGEQLLAPQNVPSTIEDISVFSEATGIPTMKTTAAQGGRIGYDKGTHPLDQVALDTFGMLFEELNPLQQIVVSNTQSKAQGGRIGYQGGIGPNQGSPSIMANAATDMEVEDAYGVSVADDALEMNIRKIAEQSHSPQDFPATDSDFQALLMLSEQTNVAIEEIIKIAQAMNFMTPQQSKGDLYSQYMAYGGRIGAQKGGIMPLLDMGGMEKDYRQDGGFVPIGRKEKADDVPARLSKNEFVFTADAVRAAGGGDIDQGAQRMYNVMKNLEAGGEISEQSQGKA